MVQFPEGNPFKTTLPATPLQVGKVIAPTAGAVGFPGGPGITAFADGADKHPAALVTVKLYVPGERPEIVMFVPVPVDVTVPG